MTSINDFFTREQANEGAKIPLVNPLGGKEEWIKIYGVDSDIFRAAKIDHARKMLSISELKTDKEKNEATETARLELFSSLVIDWSFDEPCNHAEIIDVLKNAPQITELINGMSTIRALFAQKKSKTSKTTRSQNSNSRKSQKGRK